MRGPGPHGTLRRVAAGGRRCSIALGLLAALCWSEIALERSGTSARAAEPQPPVAAVAPTPVATKVHRRAPRAIGPDGRFRDNGDGTVNDTETGLMWEKKSDDGSLHDKDLEIVWSADGDRMTVTQFLAALNRENKTGFARHHDWRLPTRAELLSIVDTGHVDPAVSRAFNDACTPGCDVVDCSCTASAYYWSPSPHDAGADARATPDPESGLPRLDLTLAPRAWHVHFHTGYVLVADETQSSFRARAVRTAD